MSKRIYKPGATIRRMDSLCKILFQGEYVYLRDRPIHPSWVISMQLRTVLIFLTAERFRKAVRL